METVISSSRIMLFCERCKKATRIGHKLLGDGAKVRICKKRGEIFQNLKGGTSRE